MDRTELLSLDRDSEDMFENSHKLYRNIHLNDFKLWDEKIPPSVFQTKKMKEGYSVNWSAVVSPSEIFAIKTANYPDGNRTLDTHGLMEISVDLFRNCREQHAIPIRIKYKPEEGVYENLAHSELQLTANLDSKSISRMRKKLVTNCKTIKWVDGYKPNCFL
ncbi:MAG: hypothetical protein ACTSYI_17060 [Promethearchaeota archaeon]